MKYLGEVPTVESQQRHEIITTFVEEISGNGFVHAYRGDKKALIWSDSLRLDLYLGKDESIPYSMVEIIPLDEFFTEWVPQLMESGLNVGINWDENELLFETSALFERTHSH